MTETVDLSCPRGCFDLEVTGSHDLRDDREFIEDVALADDTECPYCGGNIRALQELDGSRCVFCNVPVAGDEQHIRTDILGTMGYRHICKGHREHPNAIVCNDENPTGYRFCDRCERLVASVHQSGRCTGCETFLREGSVPDHYSAEAAAKIVEAGDDR
ncbi:hypothetical protein [Halosimplex pelagicum]|uniref:Uncharacterized protein n=1 Tax=Halosimplex pelagicum TaxID=869886 RepID=A0A7D5T472_9EURY|nr:hypothetical protein [Halosimplex pelagicum]QLH82431.1 hypothetical protein HZS54_12750 [Halosimplex pelagicum]QLH82487.1 hypothetical protein HZS54_13055 [Halosimplex pelagicum]